MNNKTKVLYWVITLSFTLPMVFSAWLYVSGGEEIVKGFGSLGYPSYLRFILATAKILGILAILSGVSKSLKEWAYAGFVFNFIGAFASHLFSGDPMEKAIGPIIFVALTLTSYLIWKGRFRIHASRSAVNATVET